MNEVFKGILDYGVSVIVIFLFIYDWITNKKKVNETLEQNSKMLLEMQSTNENIAKSLDITQKAVEHVQNEIIEINMRLKEKEDK